MYKIEEHNQQYIIFYKQREVTFEQDLILRVCVYLRKYMLHNLCNEHET